MIEPFHQAQITLRQYKINFRLLEHIRTNINDRSFEFFEDLVTIEKSVYRFKIGFSDGKIIKQLLLAE
jgi:hypothetical protein